MIISKRKILKTFFLLLMLFFNIVWITLPSIVKYLQEAIVVEVSTKTLNTLQAPAVTFCRYGPEDT